MRTLVADDDRVNQALVVRLLEKEGHEAVTVDNGRDALARLEKQDFDLALIDVEMPEMGGIETMALIRKKEFAMIFLTAMDTPGVKLICRPSYAMTAEVMGSPFDYPLSSRLDENDAILVFDPGHG